MREFVCPIAAARERRATMGRMSCGISPRVSRRIHWYRLPSHGVFIGIFHHSWCRAGRSLDRTHSSPPASQHIQQYNISTYPQRFARPSMTHSRLHSQRQTSLSIHQQRRGRWSADCSLIVLADCLLATEQIQDCMPRFGRFHSVRKRIRQFQSLGATTSRWDCGSRMPGERKPDPPHLGRPPVIHLCTKVEMRRVLQNWALASPASGREHSLGFGVVLGSSEVVA